MNKSNEISNIAKALCAVQCELPAVPKTKKGYGYMYADLASIIEVVTPILVKNGIAYVQRTESSFEIDEGAGQKTFFVGVETELMHTSGEWISSRLLLPLDQNKGMSRAQAAGSAIAYARRYALAAIIGLAQVDDDAPNWLERLRVFAKDKHLKKEDTDVWCKKYNVTAVADLSVQQIKEILGAE